MKKSGGHARNAAGPSACMTGNATPVKYDEMHAYLGAFGEWALFRLYVVTNWHNEVVAQV
jgi:hypothetical protein